MLFGWRCDDAPDAWNEELDQRAHAGETSAQTHRRELCAISRSIRKQFSATLTRLRDAVMTLSEFESQIHGRSRFLGLYLEE